MRTFTTVDDVMETLFNELTAGGESSNDRTGVGTKRSFGFSARLKFTHNKLMVPVFKPVNIKAVAAELYCFANGLTDVDALKRHGCNWWEANLQAANERWGTPTNRNLGPVYGAQWVKPYVKETSYEGCTEDDPFGRPVYTSQLQELVKTLRENPADRRMYVTSWNPEDFNSMALPPCYHGFQCFVNERNELDLMFHMRSADVLLGLPHDILLHQMLQILLANTTGRAVGDLLFTLGDYHLYNNQLEAVEEFRKRLFKDHDSHDPASDKRPSVSALESSDLSSFTPAVVQGMIDTYQPMPNIKVQMAV